MQTFTDAHIDAFAQCVTIANENKLGAERKETIIFQEFTFIYLSDTPRRRNARAPLKINFCYFVYTNEHNDSNNTFQRIGLWTQLKFND